VGTSHQKNKGGGKNKNTNKYQKKNREMSDCAPRRCCHVVRPEPAGRTGRTLLRVDLRGPCHAKPAGTWGAAALNFLLELCKPCRDSGPTTRHLASRVLGHGTIAHMAAKTSPGPGVLDGGPVPYWDGPTRRNWWAL